MDSAQQVDQVRLPGRSAFLIDIAQVVIDRGLGDPHQLADLVKAQPFGQIGGQPQFRGRQPDGIADEPRPQCAAMA